MQNNKEKAVFEFLIERFKRYLENEDIRYDIIEAVVAIPNDDIVDLHSRVRALNELKGKKEFITLVRLDKRVRNILGSQSPTTNPQSHFLKESEEKKLYDTLIAGQEQFENYIQARDYASALNWLINLAPIINNFFDRVLVMSPEQELRENRLALLSYLHSFFEKVADFSKIAE